MRTSHPHSVLHLHSEGATAITQKAKPDGSLEPHFFYQSPKATGSLEMALKRFFEDSKKERIYINVVSETPTLKTFKDTTLLKEPEAFAQVIEASSEIPERDCDVVFLDAKTGSEFEGNGPLLVNSFKRSEFLRAQAISSELGFQSFELFNNTLSTLGAINDWRNEFGSNETVAILEVGLSSSIATVSLADGQIVSKKIPVSLQDLAEGIQKKLKLKFESAALLLFYNGVFDFSQHKEAISAAFGEKLNPHLQNIAGQMGSEVERLLISSLPPSYKWINQEVPTSMGIKGFSPEEFYFLKDLALLGDCATNPGFIGTAFCAHIESASQPWMIPLQMQSIEVACKLNQGYAAPAQEVKIPQPEATSEIEVEDIAKTRLNELEKPPAIKISESDEYNPLEALEEFNPLEGSSSPTDIFEDSAIREIIIEEKEDDPIEVITFNETKKNSPKASKADKKVSSITEEESEKSKLGLIFGGLAALFLLGGGAFIFFQSNPGVSAPVPLPTDVAKVSNIPESELNGVSQTIAAGEPEEPVHPLSPTKKPEVSEEIPVDLFEIASAEPPAEEALIPEPVEVVIPLGRILVDSTPTGATIVVNGEQKGVTPTTIEELQFGQYAIEFKLDGYVTKLLDVSLDSEETQTVGTQLQLPLGTLEIHTTPEGVNFEVVSVEGLDRIIHKGVTPATVPDVLKGEYEIQFTRNNWEDYAESVRVRYNDISRVDLVYPEGWAMLTSIPDNASIFEKGQFIGKTPLRLKGLKEGIKHYTMRLKGYEDLEMSTEIVSQSEKRLEGELLSWDREVNYSQLDIPPTQVKHSLSNTQRLAGKNAHRFLVEFVINKEGVPEQIEVLETTYLRAHDRLLKDISKWVFEPGMRKDHPVKTRVRLPIVLGDSSKLPPAVELARTDPDDE